MGSVLQDLPVAEWFQYYNANHRRKVGKIFSFFLQASMSFYKYIVILLNTIHPLPTSLS